MVELLDQEHESVEELAIAVLDLLMDIKWGRAPYIAIQRLHDSDHFVAWGPYATIGEAERDIGNRIVGTGLGCKSSCGNGPACEGHSKAYDYAYFAKVYNKDAVEPAPEIWEEL